MEVYHVVRQLRYSAIILMRWWTHVLMEVVAQLLWGHIVSHAKDIIDLVGLRLGRLKHTHHWQLLITTHYRMTHIRRLVYEWISTVCLITSSRVWKRHRLGLNVKIWLFRRYWRKFSIKMVAFLMVASLILILHWTLIILLLLNQVQVTHVCDQRACIQILTIVQKESTVVCRVRVLTRCI